MATINAASLSMADVQTAVNAAVEGDIVQMPAGTAAAGDWGNSGSSFLYINKAITLQGAGVDTTIIYQSDGGGQYTAATIRITGAAVVKDFTINGYGWRTTPFSTSGTGWRITNIKYNGTAYTAYFVAFGGYGLIDNCIINGAAGTAELIFGRGPTNAWQTPHQMGTANCVFVEDCTFGGIGYVSDNNANGRLVIRKNLITGPMKVDAHGKASNINPARSARHTEVYDNQWTNTTNYWTAFEIRGGNGRIFNNTYTASSVPYFWLTDYGIYINYPNFNYKYQTPTYYPIDDQIGVGVDPKVAGAEPMYLWGNKKYGTSTLWVLHSKPIPAAAITQYRAETGDPLATFTLSALIRANREYFTQVNGFNGTSGVGVGTRAEMDAITPTLEGVGFWVTDEGNWNTTLAANTSGRLYVWRSGAWVFDYEPYQYPHPLRGALAAPVFTVHPTSRAAIAGASTTFSAVATANPSATFQWYKDDAAISGATQPTYQISPVTEASAGSYNVKATNSEGFVTSEYATLTVVEASDPPTFNTGPSPVTLIEGANASFTVSATGIPPPTFQWRVNAGNLSNGGRISGATTPVLTITGALEADEGVYDCVATNDNGSATSTGATLIVNQEEGVVNNSTPNPLGNRGTRARRLGIF